MPNVILTRVSLKTTKQEWPFPSRIWKYVVCRRHYRSAGTGRVYKQYLYALQLQGLTNHARGAAQRRWMKPMHDFEEKGSPTAQSSVKGTYLGFWRHPTQYSDAKPSPTSDEGPLFVVAHHHRSVTHTHALHSHWEEVRTPFLPHHHHHPPLQHEPIPTRYYHQFLNYACLSKPRRQALLMAHLSSYFHHHLTYCTPHHMSHDDDTTKVHKTPTPRPFTSTMTHPNLTKLHPCIAVVLISSQQQPTMGHAIGRNQNNESAARAS